MKIVQQQKKKLLDESKNKMLKKAKTINRNNLFKPIFIFNYSNNRKKSPKLNNKRKSLIFPKEKKKMILCYIKQKKSKN